MRKTPNGRKGFFVTGTDTGVGKTWVAAGMLATLCAQGYTTAAMKPVASGCVETRDGLRNEDALLLMRYATLTLPYEAVNPYAFAAAQAPHLAAMATQRRIDIAPIMATFAAHAGKADYVIVEGIGGWKVPLNEHQTTADLAAAFGLPVILVVGMRLGCLNHALLSCESIARHGLTLAGWVANTVDPSFRELQANISALQYRIAAPLLGTIPYLPRFEAKAIAQTLQLHKLHLISDHCLYSP